MKKIICEACKKPVALKDSFCGHCGSKFLKDSIQLEQWFYQFEDSDGLREFAEDFGGDTVEELRKNYDAWVANHVDEDGWVSGDYVLDDNSSEDGYYDREQFFAELKGRWGKDVEYLLVFDHREDVDDEGWEWTEVWRFRTFDEVIEELAGGEAEQLEIFSRMSGD